MMAAQAGHVAVVEALLLADANAELQDAEVRQLGAGRGARLFIGPSPSWAAGLTKRGALMACRAALRPALALYVAFASPLSRPLGLKSRKQRRRLAAPEP